MATIYAPLAALNELFDDEFITDRWLGGQEMMVYCNTGTGNRWAVITDMMLYTALGWQKYTGVRPTLTSSITGYTLSYPGVCVGGPTSGVARYGATCQLHLTGEAYSVSARARINGIQQAAVTRLNPGKNPSFGVGLGDAGVSPWIHDDSDGPLNHVDWDFAIRGSWEQALAIDWAASDILHKGQDVPWLACGRPV